MHATGVIGGVTGLMIMVICLRSRGEFGNRRIDRFGKVHAGGDGQKKYDHQYEQPLDGDALGDFPVVLFGVHVAHSCLCEKVGC